MKKNVLSLSITAALVGLGFSGGAQAIVTIPTGTATALQLSTDGVGHFLYVPYYSAQGANNTMINIVNTDTTNGKAVKVRFRGASNSDDVFDFQVFLSPGDVWTASVTKNAAGLASLHTNDNSCTKPSKAILNATPFVTARLDTARRTGDALANETREGYVEIFNMADIPPNSAAGSLFTAIKHVNSVPPCGAGATALAWSALDSDLAGLAAATTAGLSFPTTGLMADWIILNVADAGAWSQRAIAISANDAQRNPVLGNLVYFPQTAAPFTGPLASYTADPVLIAHPSMAAMYDTPDFSIPYLNTSALPVNQVSALSGAIATKNIYNEFLTTSSINATTDWVLSQPTRRYSVAMDYKSTASDKRVYSLLPTQYFNSTNTAVIDGQVCVIGITPQSYDQEENTPLNPSQVIISPNVPGSPATYCGEANVMSINNGDTASVSGLITSPSGTLKSTVARSAQDNSYPAGWISLDTPGLGNGLPILGYAALRATAGASTFGVTWEHKTNRVQK